MAPTSEYWFGRIGKAWRARNEPITHEALPRRWIELLHYLDEQERGQSERSNSAPPADEPKRPAQGQQ
jgi:hypothetical protein